MIFDFSSPLVRGLRGVLEYISLVCLTHPLPPLKRGNLFVCS